MEVKGITIHNTGNDKTAKEIYDNLFAIKKQNLCHYLIDEKEILQTLDESLEASHTGKGYDFGNRFTIAIEICRSQSEEDLYLKAEKKAVKFIKKLMKKYNLTKDDLYFHNDFDIYSTCPHRTLRIYKSKEEFINAYFI